MLTSEQLFIKVVESGSFKAAAEQLDIEPSSVSRKIASLEKRLNTRLLQRSTRKSQPTELGWQYYNGLKNLLYEYTALEARIIEGNEILQGKIKIAAPVDFGTRFLVPVIKQLKQQAPNLHIELLLGSQFLNLIEHGIDVSIRIGVLADSNLFTRKIGMMPRVIAASPDYLQRKGTPKTPDDLYKHTFIYYHRQQASVNIEFNHGSIILESKLMQSSITLNSFTGIQDLVRSGMGMHLGPRWFFQNDFESNQLIQVLPEYNLLAFPINAVYASRDFQPKKVKVFFDILKEHMAASGSIITQ